MGAEIIIIEVEDMTQQQKAYLQSQTWKSPGGGGDGEEEDPPPGSTK